jgi:DNA-binding CsgD family transcriptional regulator/PAS domain-containing protein
MPMRAPDLPQLVGLAYEAALGGKCEWRAFLQRLRDDFRGVQAAVFIQGLGNTPSRMLSLGDPDLDRAYDQHYGAVNPWFTEGAHLVRPGRVVTSEWYAPEDLRRSEFYAGFLRPQKMFHAVNGFIFERPGLAGNVSVARSWSTGGFSTDDLRLMELLMPHLGRAIQVQRRVSMAGLPSSAPLATAVERLPYAFIFTDARGCVVQANAAGERLLQSATALCRGPAGELRAFAPDENVRLRRALMDMIDSACCGRGLPGDVLLRISRRDAHRPLGLLICPLSASEIVWQQVPVGALVMVADPESRARPSPAALMRLYGLTRREAELASYLALGESLDDAAAAMGIGREAARTHLSRVLQKTDTHRQGELVRLLWVGVPTLDEGES